MEPITDRKISLLSFDLDGTLLNDSSDIGGLTLLRIHEALKKGVKVTLASGRVPPMLQTYVELLGMDGPYISANGALIINSRDGKLLYEKRMPEAAVMELCEFFHRNELHYSLQTGRTLYYSAGNPRVSLLEQYNRITRKYGGRESGMIYIGSGFRHPADDGVYKIIVQPQTREQSGRLRAYLESRAYLEYTFSMADLFEITLAGTDKGAAMKKVADYYRIPLSEVCAFGDYDNDISIFKVAGIGIAMGNACEKLKKIAAYQTASNNEDGIAQAIEAMWECL
jgi:Cof subfamily protein (haloacid dehalogenase superfamily)